MSDTFIHPTALVETGKIGSGTRIWAYAHVLRGAVIGDNCNIGDHAFVESGATIGNNVTLKNGVCVWEGVTLQDDVFVGPQVAFTNDLHPRSPRMQIVKERYARTEAWLTPTMVAEGATIGANATILSGIELGRYCMVAAGAVVTRSVRPFSLVMGSPARHRAHVCRCGHPAGPNFPEESCSHCGTPPDFFRQHLNPEEENS